MALSLPLPPRARRPSRPLLVAAFAAAALGGGSLAWRLHAQIEGERGIAPIATSGDFEVPDITVDVVGDNPDDARAKGWKEAQRKAFQQLVAKNGGGMLGDDAIAGLVSAVEVQHESIGRRRYIATITVVFDRARAAEHIGASAGRSHSAPLLVIPVLYDGGAATVFETRSPWQKAWAEFHTNQSVIDYVRPNGGGADSLLITAGQIDRRSRSWWRLVLDRFEASGVLMPMARIERQWPGGPITGTFTARYGPDNTFLGSTTLTAADESKLPQLMAQGVRELDAIYARALGAGLLAPDKSLNIGQNLDAALVSKAVDQALGIRPDQPAADKAEAAPRDEPSAAASASAAPPPEIASFTVQFATADADAVDAGVAIVRSVAGVKSASTSSIAIGGTSVMRVSYAGSLAELAAALRARGWHVTEGAGALSIRR